MAEKNVRVSKYSVWKRRRGLKTYNPSPRLEVRKEHAVPFLVRIGNIFLVLGGMISVFVSGIFIVVRGFFGFKKKVNEFNRGKHVHICIKEPAK